LLVGFVTSLSVSPYVGGGREPEWSVPKISLTAHKFLACLELLMSVGGFIITFHPLRFIPSGGPYVRL
jgi:hypothetical protein